MTAEEAGFQKAIDDDPADAVGRLSFADWLRDRGDPRADGHQWMAEAGVRAYKLEMRSRGRRWWWILGHPEPATEYRVARYGVCLVPAEVFCVLYGGREEVNRNPVWVYYPGRREAEDALALAYAAFQTACGVQS